jgi:hypothetical protein
MALSILNGKELREKLNIGTTTFYKFRKAGMPANGMAPVQIELCEFTTRRRAMKAYKYYVN